MTSASKTFTACAVLTVICLSLLTFWSETRNEKDRKWVVHSHLVVEELDAIHVYLSQLEASNQSPPLRVRRFPRPSASGCGPKLLARRLQKMPPPGRDLG
jgi:hypothetical protein